MAKIPFRPGDNIKITVNRRRKREDEQAASESPAPRGILPTSKQSSRYIRRNKTTRFSFYDLGQTLEGDVWTPLAFEGVLDAVPVFFPEINPGDPYGYVMTVGLPSSLWSSYRAALLEGDPDTFMTTRRKILFESSSDKYLDVWLYTDPDEPTAFAIAEPGAREYLKDARFERPEGEAETPEWTESDDLVPDASKRHVRAVAYHLYEEFDTGETAKFKITGEPSFAADEIEFNASRGDFQIFLVPRLFNERARQLGTIGAVQGRIFGPYALFPFPRDEVYQVTSLSAGDGYNQTSLTMEGTAPARARNSSLLYSRAVNRAFRAFIAAPEDPIEQGTFDDWAAFDAALTTSQPREVVWMQLIDDATGATFGSPPPLVTPPAGALVGLIKKSGANYYIWRKTQAVAGTNYRRVAVEFGDSLTNDWELE